MAKGFTPIIGLAVVVALAMAAVFGAMSLTNPAFAAVNSPADRQLAEKGFYPQVPDETVPVAIGETKYVDISSYIGGRSNFTDVTTEPLSDTVAIATTTDVSVNRLTLEVPVTGVAAGRARITVVINVGDSDDDDTVVLRVNVSARSASTEATAVREIDDVELEVATLSDPGTPLKFSVSKYFKAGTGPDGAIKHYMVTSANAAVIEVGDGDADPDDSNDWGVSAMSDDGRIQLRAPTSVITGSERITVAAVDGVTGKDDPTRVFYADVVSDATTVGDTSLTPMTPSPGSAQRFVLKFKSSEDIGGRDGRLKIEMKDFGVPSSIDEDDVIVRVSRGAGDNEPAAAGGDRGSNSENFNQPSTPQDVETDDEEIIIYIGDVNPVTDTVEGIEENDAVTITISADAGVTTPTEGGGYSWTLSALSDDADDGVDDNQTPEITVKRKISLSGNDGGRGDTITVTGKGFKNGTGINFWLDRNINGMRDAGEFLLCSTAVGSDDTASCDFDISNPPFARGVGGDGQEVGQDEAGDDKCATPYTDCNFVNAEDGRGNLSDAFMPDMEDDEMYDSGKINDQTFELKASVTATPAGGSPGDSIQIKLTDYPATMTVSRVDIGGEMIPGTNFGSTDSMGNSTFSITIPNNVSEGNQALRVYAGSVKERATIEIGGPVIRPTPSTMVANQRVSLVGTGFTPNARICCDIVTPAGHEAIPTISIGGHPIPVNRINDGQPVVVDNGGNWSAAVDLPLVNATTSEGTKPLVVKDSMGRIGRVQVTVPAREVTITPASGRVGTQAVVRGMNFPSKNDEGTSFSINVIYDAGTNAKTQISAVPDASGRFEVDLRIPTGATIPSTNQVRVEFEDSSGAIVPTTVTHMVPEGIIRLNIENGSPGSSVTVSGEGFKAFVPVRSVMVGSLEVTPSPRPSTDAQGMMSFDITIPGLDVGIQTIEVKVGETTASTGFTVTVSGVAPGDITAAAQAVENLGDKFVRAFNFNNDTKDWTFFDPAAGDANTLANFITGESYWILVTETTEVILNNKTRNLTCVGGDCWNLLVW